MAKKTKKDKPKYTSIAGQAVMEGIMMRGPYNTALAVRRGDGSITVEEFPMQVQKGWRKIPILRGVLSFIESMSVGTKMLMHSADMVIEDEEAALKAAEEAEKAAESEEIAEAAESEMIEEAAEIAEEAEAVEEIAEIAEKAESEAVEEIEEIAEEAESEAVEEIEEIAEEITPAEETKEIKTEKKEKKKGESGFLTFISTVLGLGLAVLLFFYLPTWTTDGLVKYAFPWLNGFTPESWGAWSETVRANSTVWRPIFEGILKIIIFVVYILLCSMMKEINDLFRYHGAEHKTIFCYEAGEELTVENVRKFKRFHPRCGTSFLILMLLVGILVGMAAKFFLPPAIANSNIYYPLIKVALIPVIMGIGYELLRAAGKHDNILTRIISAPGLWMQRITVREPSDDMIECAIAALTRVIPEDGKDMN